MLDSGLAVLRLRLAEEMILRLAQLVSDFDCIQEMDINPFITFEPGETSMAMDSRVILTREPDSARRRRRSRAAGELSGERVTASRT